MIEAPARATAAPPEFVCPECAEQGKETVFDSAQKLGSHRRKSHGHKSTLRGTANNNRKNAQERAKRLRKLGEHPVCPDCLKEFPTLGAWAGHRSKKHGWRKEIGDGPMPGKTRGWAAESPPTPTPAAGPVIDTEPPEPTVPVADGFDLNAILRTIFPKGIPADMEVVKRAGTLLDEASALYKLGAK